MTAILKRELYSYFRSPIAYIFIAIFYAFSGLYFYATSMMYQTADLSSVFGSMFTIVLFIIPILTMRLHSEDRRQKTDQALLTAPIKLSSIALGKYFSAVLIYLISIAITLVYGVILSFFATPDWAVIFGNFIGLFLLGAALIAICMFISALTENQVIAAVGGFAVAIIVMMTDAIASIVNVDFLKQTILSISFNQHYSNFTVGILDVSDLLFFLSVIALFVFFTVRVFEKRRWS